MCIAESLDLCSHRRNYFSGLVPTHLPGQPPVTEDLSHDYFKTIEDFLKDGLKLLKDYFKTTSRPLQEYLKTNSRTASRVLKGLQPFF